jgi:hypothetical protein
MKLQGVSVRILVDVKNSRDCMLSLCSLRLDLPNDNKRRGARAAYSFLARVNLPGSTIFRQGLKWVSLGDFLYTSLLTIVEQTQQHIPSSSLTICSGTMARCVLHGRDSTSPHPSKPFWWLQCLSRGQRHVQPERAFLCRWLPCPGPSAIQRMSRLLGDH